MNLEVFNFQSSEMRGKKKVKGTIFLYQVFHCLAKDIESCLRVCISYLIYSQIWLNLHLDAQHIFYILWLIATLAASKNSLKDTVSSMELILQCCEVKVLNNNKNRHI